MRKLQLFYVNSVHVVAMDTFVKLVPLIYIQISIFYMHLSYKRYKGVYMRMDTCTCVWIHSSFIPAFSFDLAVQNGTCVYITMCWFNELFTLSIDVILSG